MKNTHPCEQFVVDELMKTRKELEQTYEMLDKMKKLLLHQYEVDVAIKKNLELRPAPGGETELISMGLIFEQYDKKDFDLLKNYFFAAEKDDESADGEG